jgi:hypothetical protein
LAEKTQRRWETEEEMSSFDGAVVNEQGVTFGIAVVRRSVLDNPTARNEAVAEFSAVFGGIPTVLMAQDSQGTPTYYGRRDIVDFLGSIPMESIPWQHYSTRKAA